MRPVDRRMLARFVRLAADRLEGDWVILGGAVLPLLGASQRATNDIDVAGPEDAPQSLALMEIAESLGLPVEAINQAGGFFLRRIDGWQDHLVPLRKGRNAVVFRPDATLFILLKMSRLTESDLDDCLRCLEYAARTGESVDVTRAVRSIRAELGRKPSPRKAKRLRRLRAALGERRTSRPAR